MWFTHVKTKCNNSIHFRFRFRRTSDVQHIAFTYTILSSLFQSTSSYDVWASASAKDVNNSAPTQLTEFNTYKDVVVPVIKRRYYSCLWESSYIVVRFIHLHIDTFRDIPLPSIVVYSVLNLIISLQVLSSLLILVNFPCICCLCVVVVSSTGWLHGALSH